MPPWSWCFYLPHTISLQNSCWKIHPHPLQNTYQLLLLFPPFPTFWPSCNWWLYDFKPTHRSYCYQWYCLHCLLSSLNIWCRHSTWQILCYCCCLPTFLELPRPSSPLHYLWPSKFYQSPSLAPSSSPCQLLAPSIDGFWICGQDHLSYPLSATSTLTPMLMTLNLTLIGSSTTYVTSSSQHFPLPIPIPSFFIDNFMTFSSSYDFIELSVFYYIDSLLAWTQVTSLNTCHNSTTPTSASLQQHSSHLSLHQIFVILLCGYPIIYLFWPTQNGPSAI